MYYKKKETYTFSLPREYHTYLEFKEKLEKDGTRFLEESVGDTQVIIIVNTRMNTYKEENKED